MLKNGLWFLSVACMSALVGCGQSASDAVEAPMLMKVSVVQPKNMALAGQVKLSGSFVARDDVAVGTTLQGKQILSVNVNVGAVVKKGQVLATLEANTVQSQLEQHQANLARSQANLMAQQSALKEAQLTLNRYRELAQNDAVSRQELDQQQAKAEASLASVQATKAEIAQIQAQINDSRHERNKAQVLAPVDGVITKRSAEVGALAGSEALFHIAKNGTVELEAGANVDELSQLQTGLPAVVELADGAYQIHGKVRLIFPEIDASTRLGKVRIAVEQSQNLPIGAYASAKVSLPEKMSSLVLPFSAVSFGNGQTSVMTVNKQGVVERHAVEVGHQQNGLVEIVSGLQANEQVVKQAGAFVSEGDKVEPQLVKDEVK